MAAQTTFTAVDLGITEQQAMATLESSGSHDLRGFIRTDSGRVFYDCLTERSDVTVTTACVGDSPSLAAHSPRDVVGYRLFVIGHTRGLFLQSTDRPTVKSLHDLAVHEARLGGAEFALNRVRNAAYARGIDVRDIGTGRFQIPSNEA